MACSRTIIAWTLAVSLAFSFPSAAWGDAEPSNADNGRPTVELTEGTGAAPDDPDATMENPTAEDDATEGGATEGDRKASEGDATDASPLDGLSEDAEKPEASEEPGKAEDEDDLESRRLDGEDVPEGAYTLSSALPGGYVLDVSGASLENGANVQLWSPNASNAQRFWISFDEATQAFRIQDMHAGKALDVAGGGQESGTNVQQWLLDRATPNQLWDIVSCEDGSVTLISRTNALALDVSGGSAFAGANVQTWEPNGTAAQRFVLAKTEPLQEALYTLQSTLSGNKALDVRGGSAAAETPLQLWDANGVTAQKFSLEAVDEGSYRIVALCSGLSLRQNGTDLVQSAFDELDPAFLWEPRPGQYGIVLVNAESGRAIDVAGGNAASGTDVDTWEVNGTRAQGFFPIATTPVSPGTYRVRCVADGRVLDVSGASFANGANVQLWADNGTGAQRWDVTVVDGGGIVLRNSRSRLALDVLNAAGSEGTNVQQWSHTPGNVAQTFYPEPTGDGAFYLRAACSGLYLDAAGGGGYDGANVQTWTPNRTQAQKFLFERAPWSFTTQDARDSIHQAGMHWGISSFGGYAPSSSTVDRLQSAVDRARRAGVEVSVLMCDLQTGQGIAVNGDRRIYSASTCKGPYVASVAGTNPWAASVWSGVMRPTITVSSNSDYLALYNAFGRGPILEWARRAGIDGGNATSNGHYPYYSARELALLWTVNYDLFTTTDEGRAISPWYVRPLNSSIGAHLGSHYLTWSKAGWIGQWGVSSASDAGIVWGTGGPYVVALLTDAPANFSFHPDILWALEAAHNEMTAGRG